MTFRSKGTELRKKLGGTFKRETFSVCKKAVLANSFSTTGQIQLILVPLDQKLAELTSGKKKYSKKQARKFSEIVFSKLLN